MLTLLLGIVMVRPLSSCLHKILIMCHLSIIRWSAEFGASRNGCPEMHVMLAEYIYSESPETVTCHNSLADKKCGCFLC